MPSLTVAAHPSRIYFLSARFCFVIYREREQRKLIEFQGFLFVTHRFFVQRLFFSLNSGCRCYIGLDTYSLQTLQSRHCTLCRCYVQMYQISACDYPISCIHCVQFLYNCTLRHNTGSQPPPPPPPKKIFFFNRQNKFPPHPHSF